MNFIYLTVLNAKRKFAYTNKIINKMIHLNSYSICMIIVGYFISPTKNMPGNIIGIPSGHTYRKSSSVRIFFEALSTSLLYILLLVDIKYILWCTIWSLTQLKGTRRHLTIITIASKTSINLSEMWLVNVRYRNHRTLLSTEEDIFIEQKQR